METTTSTKKPQGFAALTPEQRSHIASMGGKAAWVQGRAHRWTSKEAADAGYKGVAARQRRQRGFKEEL